MRRLAGEEAVPRCDAPARELEHVDGFSPIGREHPPLVKDWPSHSNAGRERKRELTGGLPSQNPRRPCPLCAEVLQAGAEVPTERELGGGAHKRIDPFLGL